MSINCICLKVEKLFTVQANYLKEVVSQDPAYVIGRYESRKFTTDKEVHSICWQVVYAAWKTERAAYRDGDFGHWTRI